MSDTQDKNNVVTGDFQNLTPKGVLYECLERSADLETVVVCWLQKDGVYGLNVSTPKRLEVMGLLASSLINLALASREDVENTL